MAFSVGKLIAIGLMSFRAGRLLLLDKPTLGLVYFSFQSAAHFSRF